MFSISRISVRIKTYCRENLGFPFVAGFEVLLVICASLLFQGNSGLANEIALYAYYSLIVGVFLQFLSFLTQKKRTKKTD